MKNILLIILGISLLSGCSKQETPPVPGKALLALPAQNSLCTSGTVVTDALNQITFTWAATENTDGYEIDVKNLITGSVISQLTTTPQVQMILSRNTPYSWFVISRSSSSTTATQSDTWKFYNAGVGIKSYAPFPAAIISPAYGQTLIAGTNTVNLKWSGSDVDNDIVSYDVYFGSLVSPPLLTSGVTSAFLNNISISTGTYYWKVVTKDSQGNASATDIYQFKVN